ncbi:type VII secretion-associated protein [Nocardia aurantia]|uniref:Type VII secretion-associated protein n=1 Tax=Nocardia aurantia TaxID=2585199 RepID=A0A7K0DH92_9NOCA|nr:type VII secretion-associated protein [Nocardia aurantia]MQY25059.1 hypothetical protein [Nocardia aurantia]
MADIDVVLTDARLWARGYPGAAPAGRPPDAAPLRTRTPNTRWDNVFTTHEAESTHWDRPASIMPAGDGFVVGVPLRPSSPAVSVPRMASAERIAFDPVTPQGLSPVPTPAEAFAELFAALPDQLRLLGPCRRLTVVVPTEWGKRRRDTVDTAARRIAADVSLESLAQRAVSLGASSGPGQRIAVLEANPLTTTVTLVGRSGTRTWIEACEHDPTVGTDDEDGAATAAVAARLPDFARADHVLVTGPIAPDTRAAVRAALEALPGCPADIRTVSGADLLRPPGTLENAAMQRFSLPTARATGSLRDHAASLRRSRTRRVLLPAAVIAVAIVAVTGIAVGVAHRPSAATGSPAAQASSALKQHPSGSPGTVAAAPESAPAVRPNAPAERTTTPGVLPTAPGTPGAPAGPPPPPGLSTAPGASPIPAPGAGTQLFDLVRADIPPGWHPGSRTDARVDLVPDNGARQRITVTQRQLSPGATLGDVAATLDQQIAQRPPGSVGELQRDSVFGDRPGLTYEEYPGDGTTVRWQVLVDSGVQVSVGCQYESHSWPAAAGECERFVRSVHVGA